ncbi:hypothetical protein H8S90_06835 [Olivibacter sp. SDN3]|uniref:hypothetical protein n=1 Tax=Olivibacter sp. SDN3 TaxID=2764720 RepID=UPI00165127E3|nr:hypothetical protein [Olivibacter sp. SDN3]QNL51284.1 hypothetical protein H8S90_06835 [Olivibacter sp. SDN3]
MSCFQKIKTKTLEALLDIVVERYTNIDERFGKAEIEERRSIIGSMYPENICFDGTEHRTARLSEPIGVFLLINRQLKGIKKWEKFFKIKPFPSSSPDGNRTHI